MGLVRRFWFCCPREEYTGSAVSRSPMTGGLTISPMTTAAREVMIEIIAIAVPMSPTWGMIHMDSSDSSVVASHSERRG